MSARARPYTGKRAQARSKARVLGVNHRCCHMADRTSSHRAPAIRLQAGAAVVVADPSTAEGREAILETANATGMPVVLVCPKVNGRGLREALEAGASGVVLEADAARSLEP